MNFHKPFNPDLQSTAGLPAREVVRAPDALEPYCPMSIELLMAWNSIQRFRVKDRNKVKSGTYVSMRPTHALDNVLCEIFVFAGRPEKDKNKSLRFTKSKSRHVADPFNPPSPWTDSRNLRPNDLWLAPHNPPAGMSAKKIRKHTLGGGYLQSLIPAVSTTGQSKGNTFFRFNAKVMAFVDMLQRATRYEQYTVLTGTSHNVFDYAQYRDNLIADKQYSDMMHAELIIHPEPSEPLYWDAPSVYIDVHPTNR